MGELKPFNPILIVDDDKEVLKCIEIMLRTEGYNNIVTKSDSRDVLFYIEKNKVELLLLDLTMPGISGEEILKKAGDIRPEMPVIVITGLNDVNIAVKCMKTGAEDYLLKPVERNRLLSSVNKTAEVRELRRQYKLLKQHMLSDSLENPDAFSHIITANKKMLAIFKYMEAIAKSGEPVLITGETGAGKELFAKSIYNLSGVKGEFITVNVAGLDDNMFTDTLFGHKKGAFTDAASRRDGLVEQASGGVLFLDEIGDLSVASQVKLLRLIQEKEYYPLGSDISKRASCRIVVATNKNLRESMEAVEFRKDLFYRLSVHTVAIPPLRERKSDIPLLLDHFLELSSEELGKKKPYAPPELSNLLCNYSFPGNVRELKAMVHDAVSQHEARILSMDVFNNYIDINRDFQAECVNTGSELNNIFTGIDGLPSVRSVEVQLIEEAMRRADNNQSVAARLIGITRQTLRNKLKNKSM